MSRNELNEFLTKDYFKKVFSLFLGCSQISVFVHFERKAKQR